ncbi:MAG: type II toxin-antitoxin system RelE/ParE family toxin [Methanobacteriota archaeon]
MPHACVFSPELESALKKLKKKDPVLYERFTKKILQIAEKPELYKTLTHVGGKYRRVHINPFVLVFTIEGETINFLYLEHHDKAYRRLR